MRIPRIIEELYDEIKDCENDLYDNECITVYEFDDLENCISDMRFCLRTFENSFERYVKKIDITIR